MKSFCSVIVFNLVLMLSSSVLVVAGPKDKEKTPTAGSVDSGSFSIVMHGRRVGTETFSITQNSAGSLIQSDFKTEGATQESEQHSELQLTPSGEIRRYEWKEISPGTGHSVIEPDREFLMQRFSSGPQEKQQEQPYILPASTTILDDYFFVHREILAWKYLGTICRQEKVPVECPLKQRGQFGTLNPHQRASAPVTLEYLGREKTTIRGTEQELNKVELKSEAGAWLLWLDNQFKLQRILIPAENTEITRE